MSATNPASLYGFGLKLEGGDLVFDGGDLALVSGAPCFLQDLQVMIGTPFGSDPVNVKYGLDVAAIFTLADTVRGVKDVIRLNLVKSLSLDDRVREILAVAFDDEPEFAVFAPNQQIDVAASRRSRRWSSVAAFTNIGGDQQTLVVSGALP
jgi:hypothetical protein